MYVFALLLIYAAIRLILSRDEEVRADKHLMVRWLGRLFPVSNQFHGRRFFVKCSGKWMATPMLVALILIESCDVMFAVDSIPAVFGVTRDPFIVFTSNIFAILGLRSLYFALAGLLHRFDYLKMALIVLLLFIGAKMLLFEHFPIPNSISLLVISAIIGVGIATSILLGRDSPATKRMRTPDTTPKGHE